MKQSMVDILVALGFKYSRDLTTIIPPDAFERLDDNLVLKAIDDYKISLSGIYHPLDEETKFEAVNRILELKHEMIITEIKEVDRLLVSTIDKDSADSSKDVDSREEQGYVLEKLTVAEK